MGKPYNKKFNNKIPLKGTHFQEILNFYLFECPVDGTSKRAKTFKEQGWKGSGHFSTLKSQMLKNCTESLRKNYYPCKRDELETNFDKVKSVSPVDEYCVFLRYEENTVMQSLFSAIRNAFAHGSFSVRCYNKVNVYFLSNFHNGYLKAEIILQEQTLLNWIKIFKSNPNSFKQNTK